MAIPQKSKRALLPHIVILGSVGFVFLVYPAIARLGEIGVASSRWIRLSLGTALLAAAVLGVVAPAVRRRFVVVAELSGSVYTVYFLYLLGAAEFSSVYFGLLLCAIAGVSYMARHAGFFVAYAALTTFSTAVLTLQAPELGAPGFLFPFLVALLLGMGYLSLRERNQALGALQEEKESYRSVVEDQTELICRYLTTGETLFINTAFADFLGTDPDSFVGTDMLEVLSETDRSTLVRRLGETPVGGTVDFEGTVEVPGKGPRSLRWCNRIISRGTQGTVVQAVGRDTTADEEAALERSRFIAAIEYSPLGIGVSDENSRLQFMNQAMENMFGYSVDEIRDLGGPASLVLNPEELEPVLEAFEAGRSFSGPMTFRRRDGSTLEHYVNMAPIQVDGVYRGVVSTHTDAMERQKALGALHESEERFRQVAEHIREAVFLRDQGRTLYANPAFEELFKRSRRDIYGTADGYAEWIHPDDRSYFTEETGRNDQAVVDLTYRILTPDSAVKWVRHRTFPVANSSGSHGRTVTVISDITESKVLERSLTLFKRGIEQTNDAVAITNGQGEITFVNRAMEDLTGYTFEELQGIGEISYFYADQEQASADAQRLFREGSVVTEQLLRDRRGREHAVLVRGNSIVDADGVLLGTILIHFNLDEARRYEAQLIRAKQRAEEANRAKSVFLANMSHEIRTPINGVLGLLRLLPEADAETQRTYYRLIEESSSSLVQLIDDILDLSRIEADRLTLMPQAFSIPELLRHVSSFFAADVEQKGLSFSVEIEEGLPETIVTDRVRLQQVLTNLIGNAVKYTEEGGVAVRVFRGPEGADSAVTIGFAVKDTGIGISEQNRERLFEFFEQVEEGYARRYGGAGVGLAVSKRLVEMMGGEITVESSPGDGSTFTFTLDAVMDRRSEARHEDKQMTLELRGGLRILLAEDNEINLLAMRVQLERGGHQVTVARDGLEALEHYKAETFDVALLDVQMPNMDGVEVVRRIREAEGTGTRLPVFAVTAYAMDEQKVRFMEAGFDEVIVKPVAPDALSGYLARLWEKRGDYETL